MRTVIDDRRALPIDAATAWRTLTDWRRAAEWMPGVSDMRANGALAVDTLLTYTAQGARQESTVTAVEPGRSVTITSRRGGVTADYRYVVEPAGAGCTVALVATVAVTGPMRLLGGVIRRAIARADGSQLERFAALVC